MPRGIYGNARARIRIGEDPTSSGGLGARAVSDAGIQPPPAPAPTPSPVASSPMPPPALVPPPPPLPPDIHGFEDARNRVKFEWEKIPKKERSVLEVGAYAIGALAVTAVVIAIARR